MTLVVLAAGMGSRYGGLKQIDPITENGEFIIDFSIYDAIKAGFNKVVFIIQEKNFEDFKNTIGNRISKYISVEYVFQSLDKYVESSKIPEQRVKQWGTMHAILCCKDIVNESFAVINSDDYYGRDAYYKLYDFLTNNKNDFNYSMIGYKLKNTMTDNGSVARGICSTENGKLVNIVERTKIFKTKNGAEYDDNGLKESIPIETTVSMNMWGFKKSLFDLSMPKFLEFINDNAKDALKSECFLPNIVGELLNEKKCSIDVLSTDSVWFGVTYKEDKKIVMDNINKLINMGYYPKKLWN